VYIRAREEAFAALADILDLPERPDQLDRSAAALLSCLDAEPRRVLQLGRRLLFEDAPRRDGDLAPHLEALELSELIRQVFPELRAERWLIARALARDIQRLREDVAAALRARGRQDERTRARKDVEAAVAAARPDWIDRAGALRSACLAALKAADVEDRHQAADLLFAVLAVSDDLAQSLFADPESADARLAGLLESLRAA
jgi:hypothetical protein